jgi:hypothetical protein
MSAYYSVTFNKRINIGTNTRIIMIVLHCIIHAAEIIWMLSNSCWTRERSILLTSATFEKEVGRVHCFAPLHQKQFKCSCPMDWMDSQFMVITVIRVQDHYSKSMLIALIFVYLSLISRSRPEKFRIQYYQKVKVLHYIFP